MAKNEYKIEFDFSEVQQRMKIYKQKAKAADELARGAAVLQLMNFVVNGSPRESVVPPIKEGILRGSVSVFAGSRKFGDTKSLFSGGNPVSSYRTKKNEGVLIINTAYAARLHELPFSESKKRGYWSPGPVSQQSGDVGNKYVEKHLKADRKALTAVYADVFKRKTGG